tara:strand:+ start:41986 stop:42504 length:519 start_codon:yes stop_codon:yes gene_type:complete
MNKIDKNKSFKVPDGYFETLSGNIMDKIYKEENTMSPSEGFKVPDGYFENLNTKILQKLENSMVETKVIPLKSYKKHIYAVASIAAILLLFITIQFNGNKTLSYSDLANSEIEQYFEFNELELSSYDLAEILPINDWDQNDIMDNRLDNDNILDYLNSHIEDFEELNLHNDD